MKKLKSVVSLTLALSLLLCGCADKGKSDSDSASKTNEASETSETSAVERIPTNEITYSEKTDLFGEAIAYKDFKRVKPEHNYDELFNNKKKLVIALENQFGIMSSFEDKDVIMNEFNRHLVEDGYDFIVDFIYIDNNFETAFYEKTEKHIENGGQIDIMFSGLQPFSEEYLEPLSTYHECIKNGLFIPLDDYLATDEGSKLKNAYPDIYWEATTYNDGKIYGLSNNYRISQAPVMFFNEAKANEYSLDTNSYSDIYSYEEYFQKAYDDGLAPMQFPHLTNFYTPEIFGYIPYNNVFSIKESNGGYEAINIFEDDNFINHALKMADYAQKGWLQYSEQLSGILISATHFDKGVKEEAEMLKNLTSMPHFTETRLAFSELNQASLPIINSDIKDLDGKNINLEMTYAGPAYLTKKFSNAVYGILSSSQYQEDAKTLLTLLATDYNLATILNYGVEGYSYVIESNTVYLHSIVEENEKSSSGVAYNLLSPANPTISYPTEAGRNKLSDIYTEHYKHAKFVDFSNLNVERSSVMREYMKCVEIYNKYSPLWMGCYLDNTDDIIKQANDALKKAGIDDVLAEINLQLGN